MNQFGYSQYAYVSGIDGAESYQMTPNSTMLLMDSRDSFFYLKTTDQMGRTSMLKRFKFEEVPLRDEEQTYASVADIKKIMTELDHIKNMMNGGKVNE